MTLRELLKDLQALDPKSLDQPVLASPHTGGYSGIDRIEVMYVGNVVLHLMDAPKLTDKGKELFSALQRKK